MKKQNLKSLRLSKQKIADFNTIVGGIPPKSFFEKDCKEPEPVSRYSCFIESNCIGCTVTTQSA